MSVVSRKILEEYDELKPFSWHIPHDIPDKAIIDEDYDDIKYIRAIKLNPEECKHTLLSQISEDKLIKMAALPAMTSYPIVNREILSLLNELCPKDFQAIQLEIKNHPKEKKLIDYSNKDYYMINILNFSETIDFECSLFSYRNPDINVNDILLIDKLVFKQDCMNGHHLVRDRHSKSLVVASRELALLLNKHKVIGVELRPDYAAYEYYNRYDRGG